MPCRENNWARGKEVSFKLKNKEVPTNRHKETTKTLLLATMLLQVNLLTTTPQDCLTGKEGTHKSSMEKTWRERAITRMEKAYGFTHKPSISAFSTTPLYSQKLAFHDLTPGQIIPDGVKTIFGLGAKVIHTPNLQKVILQQASPDLIRIWGLKDFFAGPPDPMNEFFNQTSKMHVQSKWTPKWDDSPGWVDSCLIKFASQIWCLFIKQQVMPNLLQYQWYQEQMLEISPWWPIPSFPRNWQRPKIVCSDI